MIELPRRSRRPRDKKLRCPTNFSLSVALSKGAWHPVGVQCYRGVVRASVAPQRGAMCRINFR